MLRRSTLSSSSPCPCGLPTRYSKCCGRWHTGSSTALEAPNPLLLMRSRYAAYVIDDIEYLINTWHPSTRPTIIEPNEPDFKWLGLTIKAYDPEAQTVKFAAKFRVGRAAPEQLLEHSRFVFENKQWWYLDAIN